MLCAKSPHNTKENMTVKLDFTQSISCCWNMLKFILALPQVLKDSVVYIKL